MQDAGAGVLERIDALKLKGHAWLEEEIDRTDAEYRRIGDEQSAVGTAHLEALMARYYDNPDEWNRVVGFPWVHPETQNV